jgi:hypothetical protein
MLFVWGGLAAGLYTVALAELGARYSGATLVSATAAIVTAYGVGALVGPLFVGRRWMSSTRTGWRWRWA